MRVSVWFEFFDGLFLSYNMWYMGRKRGNKEGELNKAHLFPRVLRYKRGSDIMEVRLYLIDFTCQKVLTWNIMSFLDEDRWHMHLMWHMLYKLLFAILTLGLYFCGCPTTLAFVGYYWTYI